MARYKPVNPFAYAMVVAALAEPRPLSPRQREVVSLMAQGLGNGEIAERLSMKPKRVADHVYELKIKLHARTRADVVAAALARGLMVEQSEPSSNGVSAVSRLTRSCLELLMRLGLARDHSLWG